MKGKQGERERVRKIKYNHYVNGKETRMHYKTDGTDTNQIIHTTLTNGQMHMYNACQANRRLTHTVVPFGGTV